MGRIISSIKKCVHDEIEIVKPLLVLDTGI